MSGFRVCTPGVFEFGGFGVQGLGSVRILTVGTCEHLQGLGFKARVFRTSRFRAEG